MTTEDDDGMVLGCRRIDDMMDGMTGKALLLEGNTLSLPTVAGSSVLRALGSRSVAATN